MTAAEARVDRAEKRQVDKFELRRQELADAALQTLSELGYARTSLREIAQNSAFSHGVLHYYFRDKVDLITYCVRRYKAECVRRYDRIVTDSDTAAQVARDFGAGLAATMAEDGTMHRLWYDLRSQALFETSFREDVLEIDATLQDMVWRIVSRYAELAGAEVITSPAVTYAMFDGQFQQALLHHLAGDPGAGPRLDAAARQLLTMVVPITR
ncbi:TetR/AcrR family transcriptional regulator [Pseudonocardia sp. CA-107938]|uniref:TetR/AcrR family transcriptional regulator n=1 Tax=Pseudonocardia sp. CA-107938 TaxID=3240021 RepID=UPI003D8B882C